MLAGSANPTRAITRPGRSRSGTALPRQLHGERRQAGRDVADERDVQAGPADHQQGADRRHQGAGQQPVHALGAQRHHEDGERRSRSSEPDQALGEESAPNAAASGFPDVPSTPRTAGTWVAAMIVAALNVNPATTGWLIR